MIVVAKYCVKCGAKNKNDDDICSCCGMALGGKSVGNPSGTPKPVPDKKNILKTTNNFNNRKNNINDVKTSFKTSRKAVVFDPNKLNQSNQLLENGLIQEVQCQKDFIYVLEDNADLLSTEYKVLNSVGDNGMLKCKKFKYNGKDALYYMVDELKSFDIIWSVLEPFRLLLILENLLNQLSAIKSNGFLSDMGIDIRLKRIFVNPVDGKIYLTYVPVNQRCYSDWIYLEQNLRMDLSYMIQSDTNIQSKDMMNLVQMLEEPACSFGNLMSFIRQNCIRMTGVNR